MTYYLQWLWWVCLYAIWRKSHEKRRMGASSTLSVESHKLVVDFSRLLQGLCEQLLLNILDARPPSLAPCWPSWAITLYFGIEITGLNRCKVTYNCIMPCRIRYCVKVNGHKFPNLVQILLLGFCRLGPPKPNRPLLITKKKTWYSLN